MKNKIKLIPKNKLVFGTAQFFKNYGIKNKNNESGLKLLETACENGCKYFDTSDLYGASYKLIEKNQKNLNLIIKVSIQKNNKLITLKNFKKKISKVISEIKKNKIYGILIHDFNLNYTKDFENHYNYLKNFCKKKKIKFGFSLYNFKEFNYLKNKYQFNLIQVPINVFNREFLNTEFKRFVKQKKIEIHIRSIFLQGLLVNELRHVPNKLKFYKNYLLKWENFCKKLGVNKIEGCINFLSKQNFKYKFVIGFKSRKEFLEILNLKITKKRINYNEFEKIPLLLKSPNLWKKL